MKNKKIVEKVKLAADVVESGNDIPLKDMNILDHIEKIVKISQEFGIDNCMEKGKKHFDYVTKKLGISPIQAVLFSHFMENADDTRIQISRIAESIKCSKVRIIKYMNDCDELEKKKLIRCRREDDGISYRIPRAVWDSLRKKNKYVPEKNENLSINKFFAVLDQIFDERDNNELTYDTMKMELQDLINQNMHLEFCKKIMSYKLSDNDLVLLLCFCPVSITAPMAHSHSSFILIITEAALVSTYQLTVSLNNTHSRGALKQCFSISGTRTTGGTRNVYCRATFFWN
jgi:hypothetical protein